MMDLRKLQIKLLEDTEDPQPKGVRNAINGIIRVIRDLNDGRMCDHEREELGEVTEILEDVK